MEEWKYLYENTILSTNEIETALGLVKDSVRQKARVIYPDEYRLDREREVRGWPAEDPKWIHLYENTHLTHLEISKYTGMSEKQLFKRIKKQYSEEARKARKFVTYQRARLRR